MSHIVRISDNNFTYVFTLNSRSFHSYLENGEKIETSPFHLCNLTPFFKHSLPHAKRLDILKKEIISPFWNCDVDHIEFRKTKELKKKYSGNIPMLLNVLILTKKRLPWLDELYKLMSSLSQVSDNIKFADTNFGWISKYNFGCEEYIIRVMPGHKDNPWPNQKKPYVIIMYNNGFEEWKFLDKNHNFVKKKSKESHIPLEEFIDVKSKFHL